MNRCYLPLSPNVVARALACALALAIGTSAWAQTYDRPFPANVKRGAMVVTAPPEIQMDGKPDRLSPGSRIRAANNMLVVSGALIGQPVLVNYLREPTGMVHDVWILTPSEAAKPLPTAPQ